MNISRSQLLTLAATGCAALLSAPGAAQETTARFAAPKRIQAGETFLGAGRLYPSPVLHDVDGDERPDIVIGDLIGRVTVAHAGSNKSVVSFGSEKQLKDRSGEQLTFHNW